MKCAPEAWKGGLVQGTRCDMLSTCNCHRLASDTTGEYECDRVGIHDIERRNNGALGNWKGLARKSISCPPAEMCLVASVTC